MSIFDEIVNRRGSNSVKWDSRSDIPADTVPLWVADMDFKAAPAIIEALTRRVNMGVFGYTFVPHAYYQAVTDWFERYHGWTIDPKQIIYTSGVVPALSAIIKALTKPGDKVLIQTPVYNCFFSSIRNNGCTALEGELVFDGVSYHIDFQDLEEKMSDPACKLMLLCNPHNPAGRVWRRDELQQIDALAQRHGVLVVSDEIHCELVFKGYEYTPWANVATGPWISCVSPSKAFNIAGLQIANIVLSNSELRAKVDRAINDNEVCDVNPFGVDALIAAYTQSRPWLEELLVYLQGNYELLCAEFAAKSPEFKVAKLEGTYLAWVDCRHLGIPSAELEEMLIEKAHVWVNPGSMYGTAGEGFIRINLACPRSVLAASLGRLLPALRALK